MSHSNLTQTSPTQKTYKYQHVGFSIDKNTVEGRAQIRNLIRAHFRFVLDNLTPRARRKYVGIVNDMSMWLLNDEMLRDPVMSQVCNLREKDLDLNIEQIGTLRFKLNKGKLEVVLDRYDYFAEKARIRRKEKRLKIAADLLKTSTELAEVA